MAKVVIGVDPQAAERRGGDQPQGGGADPPAFDNMAGGNGCKSDDAAAHSIALVGLNSTDRPGSVPTS